MKVLFVLAMALGACAPTTPAAPTSPPAARDSVADWRRHFEAEGAIGTFVLYDPARGVTLRYNPDRAAERFTPASTSKVFNGLVFLDQGAVTDVDSMFAWDGVERSIAAWNQDHSLRTGTQVSAVWLFQRLAGFVGRAGYADVFAREPYGNSTLSDSLEMSWLDGAWRISADEQVVFFDRLRRGDLAFEAEHQALAREILPVLAESDSAVLKGKTGWGGYDRAAGDRVSIGWLVGWVERPEGDVVYAMNAEAAAGRRFDIGPGRLRIVRAVLADAEVFPQNTRERP